MKRKLLSLTMALVLTCSLFATVLPTAPASAATLMLLAERDIPTVGIKNDVLGPPGIDIVDLAVSGNITFAATNSIDYPLYKSTNAGFTWSSLGTSISFPAEVSVKAVAIAGDDPNVVAIVTSANEIEYSTNGGAVWTNLGAPAAGATINGIDVSPSMGGYHYIAAGGDDGIGAAELYTILLVPEPTWTARTVNPGFAANQDNITAVKFSPNFATDKIITVVSGSDTEAYFQVFCYESGAYTWNGQIAYDGMTAWGTGILIDTVTGGVAAADIALPASYLGTNAAQRLAFAGLAGATSGGGVYRLNDTSKTDFATSASGDEGQIHSVAYHESGILLAGDYDQNQVYRCLSPMTDPQFEPLNSLKQPGGVNKVVVAWAYDRAKAGTSGDESAFASSMNGSAWSDIGLIDTTLSVMSDFAVSANGTRPILTTYDTSEDSGAYDASVWMKGRLGWVRWLSMKDFTTDANAALLVRIPPEDTLMGAVYVASKASQDMWFKPPGSANWTHVPAYNLSYIQDFVVASADVVYAIDANGCSKTTDAGASWSKKKSLDGMSYPQTITLAPNGDVLVGGIGDVAFSKDGGSTFTRILDTTDAAPVHIVADKDYAENNMLYIAAGDEVERGEADKYKTWISREPTSGHLDIPWGYQVTGMARYENVVYVLLSDGNRSRLYRALNLETGASPDLCGWSYIEPTMAYQFQAQPQALKTSLRSPDYPTELKLWAIDTPNALCSIIDPIATVGPTLISPANAAEVPVNPVTGRAYDVAFFWQRYPHKNITEMELQIATNSAFTGILYDQKFKGITTDVIAQVIGPTGVTTTETIPTWVATTTTTPAYTVDTYDGGGALISTTYYPEVTTFTENEVMTQVTTHREANLMPGTTYYWRVRVTNTQYGPMLSPWSATRSVSVAPIPQITPIVVPEAGVSVSINAPTWVPEGYNFTATVAINQVENFDTANYNVSFDPTVLEIIDLDPATDNVSIGSGQINGTEIPVDIANISHEGTGPSNPTVITIVQNVPGTSGVSGSGHLAELQFRAIGSQDASSRIDLSNGVISNTLAEEIPAAWVDNWVYISFFRMGDANGDGKVNAIDITKVERMIAGLD